MILERLSRPYILNLMCIFFNVLHFSLEFAALSYQQKKTQAECQKFERKIAGVETNAQESENIKLTMIFKVLDIICIIKQCAQSYIYLIFAKFSLQFCFCSDKTMLKMKNRLSMAQKELAQLKEKKQEEVNAEEVR